MEAIEQYFRVVLSVYKVVQGGFTLKFVDENLVCDHSNKMY